MHPVRLTASTVWYVQPCSAHYLQASVPLLPPSLLLPPIPQSAAVCPHVCQYRWAAAMMRAHMHSEGAGAAALAAVCC
jgi:hypothetical protein